MTGAPGSSQNAMAGAISLDGLFRANAAARPDAPALIDPANRASFTDGTPLRLTYAQLDERVARLADRLASFGMPAGSVVAVQLPNIAESIISLLAVLRAGMVAVPVPTLWGRSELVAALSGVAPKALITLSRLGDERPAEAVCEAAAELFDLSFPCAFGANVPDGVIALDQENEHAGMSAAASSSADACAISLGTFDTDADGFFAAGRSDAQWLAVGLPVFLEAKIGAGETIVTTLPANSLAGIGSAFVPWLLCGGTLELIHGHAPYAIAVSGASGRVHFVSPAAALSEIAAYHGMPFASCIAVYRGAQRSGGDFSNVPSELVVDLHCFGETAVVALARDDPRYAWPIPLGGISAPSSAIGAPVVLESRLNDGQIWVRGPMVPLQPISDAAEATRLQRDVEGFVRTGFSCHSDGNGGLIVDAGPERVVSVGGLRFGLNDLQSRFSGCGEVTKVTAVDDPLLGQRLHIEAADPDATIAAMRAVGLSRLVIDATVGAAGGRAAG
jgi:hypothetical protein